MNRVVILGGGGRVGRAIQRCLRDIDIPKVEILSVDRRWIGGVNTIPQMGDTYRWLYLQLEPSDIVISCLRPEETPKILAACKDKKVSGFIDLGGDDKITEQVRQKGKDYYPFPVVLDCGLAPGLPSSIAGWAAREGYKKVKVCCGGIPALSNDYLRSFNTDGLLGEYFGLAKIIRDSKVVYEPTLTGFEARQHRGMLLEGVYTSGGLSFTPEALAGQLETLEYKTLRKAGHWKYLRDFILWRPDRKELIEVIYPEVSSEKPDMIVLTIQLDNNPILTYFWDYDHKNNISALSLATGEITAKTALLIASNKIETGIVGMHDVDFKELI